MKSLAQKRVVLISLAAMLIMFTVVMFVVNPLIDGGNGMDVIRLQLSFDKQTGIQIASGLNKELFRRWIFTDYLYAVSYAFFLSSLISWLIKNRHVSKTSWLSIGIYLPFIAGACDWIENSIELLFFKDMVSFPSELFYLHSVLATIKWMSLPVILVMIVVLVRKNAVS